MRGVERDLAEMQDAFEETNRDLLAMQQRFAASQADLTRALAERTELLSILARIGDALSPTGERPEEALGTLAADVEAYVASHDVLEEERDRLRDGLAAAVAELYELAAANRAEAARFRGMQPPHYTGVNLLAEARGLEKAAGIVEQKLGGAP